MSAMTTQDIPATDDVQPANGSVWMAVLAALLVAVVSRFSFLGEPFQNDAAIYVYMGKVLHQGGRLYQDFWETKFPSVALLTAPLFALFGNNWLPYVAVQAAMGIGAAFALAVFGRKFIGPETFVPTLLFGLVGFNLSRLNLTGFQLETVQLFFESIAACCVLAGFGRRGLIWVFVAGLFAGLAAMAKPTGLAVAAAAGLSLLAALRQQKPVWVVGRLVALTVGVVVPIALTAAWVFTTPWKNEMPGVLREIGLYASGTPWRSLLQFKTWIFFLLPVVPLAIRLMFELNKPRVVPVPSPEKMPQASLRLFVVSWFLIEVLAVVLQRRLYSYHFLVLMPPAALLFAIFPRSRRAAPAVVAVFPLAVLSLMFAEPGYMALREPQPMKASQYIAAHTQPGDTVWGDPEARLLLETGRDAGSRLQMTFYLVNHDKAPAQFTRTLLGDFEDRKPKYIVLPVTWDKQMQQVANDTPGLKYNPNRKAAYITAWHDIDAYIHSHYRLEVTLDGRQVLRRIEPVG